MPHLVNKRAHPVRVTDNDGATQRVVPGQVVEADGKYADNLKGAGLESAGQGDRDSWDQRRQSGNPSPESGHLALQRLVNDATQAVRRLAAAVNQVVIGDDQAPLGPPTGTITTKQAVAQEAEDSATRGAFGPNEAFQIGEVEGGAVEPMTTGARVPPHREVHNAQVESDAATEAVAQDEVLAALQSATPTDAAQGEQGDSSDQRGQDSSTDQSESPVEQATASRKSGK